LLQLSSIELAEYVEQELESNPLLEADESGEGSVLVESAGNADEREDADFSVVDAVDGQTETPLDIEATIEDNEPALADDGGGSIDTANAEVWGNGAGDGERPDLESTLADLPDLRSHLIHQVNLSF